MAKRVFNAVLTADSINDLKKELLSYKTDFLQARLVELTERLAEKGVEIAKANVTKLDAIFTGELIDSLHSEKGSISKGTAIFYIVTDSKHAAFVEFGTGQLGMEGGYPYPFPNGVAWDYNSGTKIFEFSPGQYGWFYKRDEQWYFTQGMPSRPFMYETAMDLEREVVKLAKEIFARRV